MNLGSRIAAWSGGAKLPFKRIVKYIVGDGASYLDMGIKLESSDILSFDTNQNLSLNRIRTIFGDDKTSVAGDTYPSISAIYGGVRAYSELVVTAIQYGCIIDLGEKKFVYKGPNAEITKISTNNWVNPVYDYLIFARPDDNGKPYSFNTKGYLSSHTLERRGELIFNLIPVVINNEFGEEEAAMFNKANPKSGEFGNGIYRNKGSGSFGWAEI